MKAFDWNFRATRNLILYTSNNVQMFIKLVHAEFRIIAQSANVPFICAENVFLTFNELL